MLTAEGTVALADAIASWLTPARVFVGDGEQRAEVALDHEPFPNLDDGTVQLSATFGEDVGNFEWRERGVVLDGKVVDLETSDGGRKILGAVWTVRINLDVRALN